MIIFCETVMKVLGIETSCDETGLAIYDGTAGKVVGQVLHSQIELHAQYGGVVPELASRDHIRKLVPLMQTLLEQSNLGKSDIDAVAYTRGPGLVGALMTGALFGRTLAYALGVPAIGVHHMEGHLLTPMMADETVRFPFVCLLVSGGHTMLVLAHGLGNYEVLGQSIDDAAGECFDKTAKMLGLPYPGGAHISRLAQEGEAVYELPRPLLHRGLDFSFSGMKTAMHNLIKDSDGTPHTRANIAKSFEVAMVDVLVKKCVKALTQTCQTRLVIAGGVSANVSLRQTLEQALPKGASVHYAPIELCTDNGAMIAYAGFCRLTMGQNEGLAVSCVPRWEMTSLAN